MSQHVDLNEVLHRATELHRAGQIAEAEALYTQILIQQPDHADALHQLGVLALQLGRKKAAVDLIGRAVKLNANSAHYQFSFGQVLAGERRFDEAISAYHRAVQLSPKSPDIIYALAIALQAKGRRNEAIEAYRQAIALRPQFPEALNNMGSALHALGRFEEAIAAYRQAIAAKPDFCESHNNLGAALQAMGKLDDAIAEFRQALALRPDSAISCNNLGTLLHNRGQHAEAVAILRRALELHPDFAEAAYNLGNALRALGEMDQTVEAYEKAISLNPKYAEAHNNLGNAYQGLGQYDKAVDSYRQALESKPDFVDPYNNAGAALRTMGRVEDSVAVYRQALAIKPDFHPAWCNLGNTLKDMGQLDESIECYRRAIAIKPADWISHSNFIYTLSFARQYDAAAILHEAKHWNQQHAQPLSHEIQGHDNDANPQRRLRIGYVSPDFRIHCQSFFTVPLLSHHNPSEVEIFCYSGNTKDDTVTERLRGYAHHWRSTLGVPDARLAQMIRQDRIDILVDLTMHMAFGRPLVFARKPAPIQIAWLAYPGTTGIEQIDYRFTDPYLDPSGQTDADYSEQSIRLPDTFWCYDPLATEPQINALPAQTTGHITFGCLNNLCKVNADVLEIWRAVLEAIPDSHLILLSPPGSHRQRVEQKLFSGRIQFEPFRKREVYLQTYQHIDIGLDTFPYNGHTTSLDSYWMGVPVVTLVGKTVVGRAGWSQLCNLGLKELAAHTPEEFIRLATELAKDLPRLAELRRTLRPRMEKSPLMDAARFTRNMETAYRDLWRTWCQRGSP